MRSFRVDRIQAMERPTETFNKPPEFDPAQYLDEHFEGQSSYEVRLFFSADTASVAQDYRCCWESFEERPDGSVVAGFRASDLDTATRRVMCFLPRRAQAQNCLDQPGHCRTVRTGQCHGALTAMARGEAR